MPESVLVYATTGDGRVVVEKAYRHGIGAVSLVFPTGGINPEEAAIDAARRELLEETGYSAENWKAVGSYVANGNQGCGKIHLFRAEAARKVAVPGADDLEEIRVVLMGKQELASALKNGDITALSAVMVVGQALAGLLDVDSERSSS
jgi:ADP-ribose pyrophosphatase